jgi:hypothetical protein
VTKGTRSIDRERSNLHLHPPSTSFLTVPPSNEILAVEMPPEPLVNDGAVRNSLTRNGHRSVDEMVRNGAAMLAVDDIVEVQRQILDQVAASRDKQSRAPGGPADPRTARANPGESAKARMAGFSSSSALDDEEFILDQKRMLEQIQREFQAKRDAQALGTPAASVSRLVNDSEVPCPLPLSSRPRTQSSNGVSRVALEDSICPLLRDWDVLDADEAVAHSRDSFRRLKAVPEDCAMRFANGKKMRVKGARHVYKAIENGTSTLVRCFNCHTSLHVPQTCTAVYCAVCHQVTPMDLARTSAGSGSTFDDSEIAAALQRQELDVALAASNFDDSEIAGALQRQELDVALARTGAVRRLRDST